MNAESNDVLEGGNEGYPIWSVGITTNAEAGGILTESSNSGLLGTEVEVGEDEDYNTHIDWVGGMLVMTNMPPTQSM